MTSIALVLIARNEARCIERCLASTRGHVDSMFVLDTGSTDDTPVRAARAGARVEKGAWHDDFARARNDALDLVNTDWALVLDADEWIVGGLEALTALRQGDRAFLGMVMVDNLFDDASGAVTTSRAWLPRLLPRGVRYAGRIHEQPVGEWPRRRVPLQVRHDGYLRAVLQAKHARNRSLLERALAEAPDDAFLCYQLGKDLELTGEIAPALRHYQIALAGCGMASAWRHDLVLRMIFVFKRAGHHADALALVQREAARWDDSPDFHFAVGDLLLDWAATEPAKGAGLVPLIDERWQRAVAIGERPDLPDSVRGRGSYLAAHNLAVLHEGLGQHDVARSWRERETAMRQTAEADAVA